MEYARKMIIVPAEAAERLADKSITVTSSHSSNLDDEMSNILNSKHLDEYGKWKLYNQVLNRYLHFINEKRKPLVLPIAGFDGDSSNKNINVQREIDKEIISSLPSTLRNDGVNLLQKLQQLDSIGWSDDGRVTIDGVGIQNSNIVDLFHDVLRDRKKSDPPGWQEFLKYLHDKNIPTEFIRNSRRKHVLNTYDEFIGNTLDQDTSMRHQHGTRRKKHATLKKPRLEWEGLSEL